MAAFDPDTPVEVGVVPSPNCSERRGGVRPDMLILHYTGMQNADGALAWLCAPESNVSAHYFVFEDGRIVQSVPEASRAWHAGASFWRGIEDINSHSIGVEIANPGHSFGYPDFPREQIEAVTRLCRDIVVRNAISPDCVLAHSDVAPLRKEDPGEKFPWHVLHAAGVGHWVPAVELTAAGSRVAPGDQGHAVSELQNALGEYGYSIEVTGTYDDLTAAVVRAFQRHFRPACVDGVADPSTRRTLTALTAARPLTRV